MTFESCIVSVTVLRSTWSVQPTDIQHTHRVRRLLLRLDCHHPLKCCSCRRHSCAVSSPWTFCDFYPAFSSKRPLQSQRRLSQQSLSAALNPARIDLSRCVQSHLQRKNCGSELQVTLRTEMWFQVLTATGMKPATSGMLRQTFLDIWHKNMRTEAKFWQVLSKIANIKQLLMVIKHLATTFNSRYVFTKQTQKCLSFEANCTFTSKPTWNMGLLLTLIFCYKK